MCQSLRFWNQDGVCKQIETGACVFICQECAKLACWILSCQQLPGDAVARECGLLLQALLLALKLDNPWVSVAYKP